MSTQEYVEKTSGWTGFAVVVLYAVGFFRIISAISYFANSNKIENFSGGLFGGQTWAWGIWDLLIAVLAIMGANSLLKGGGLGKLVGYLWAILVIVQSFVIIGIAPWFAAVSIALAILVIHGVGLSSQGAE